MSEAPWIKNSDANGNCVEVQTQPDGGRKVRHSKHPDDQVLTFNATEWSLFIEGAKQGMFD